MKFKESDILSAIKSCEARIEHMESRPAYYYGKKQRKRAVQLEEIKIRIMQEYLENNYRVGEEV